MRRLIGFLLLIVIALALGAILISQAPRIVGVSPNSGDKAVPAGAPVRISFSRPMKAASVASRLHIEPETPGNLTWEDKKSLTFTPDQPWPNGITITVQLKAGASAEGFPSINMLHGKTWHFTVEKPLLAYLWPSYGPADIYALDPLSGEVERLTTTKGVQDFSVSSDGLHLYYSTANTTGGVDIWRLDRSSGITATLILACPDADCHAPHISPIGEFLAYERIPIHETGQPALSQVWLAAQRGGNPFPAGDPTHQTVQPDWSPIGMLAFYDITAQAYIILNPTTNDAHLFPNQTGDPGGWTADGKAYVAPEISYIPTKDTQALPTSHLLRFDWQTGQITDLTVTADVEDAFPAFSPNGKALAFARKSLEFSQWTIGRQVWLALPDGKEAYPITEATSYNHYDFAWRPDGMQLAYVRFNLDEPTTPPELWVINTDGSNSLQLVIGGYAPQWIR
jgi:Tol biopolymer transport system component